MTRRTSRTRTPIVATDALSTSCRSTLAGWVAPDIGQEQLRQHYLEHLRTHPDGWSRTCSDAHLTASSLICAPAQRQVLLTKHARIGRWLQTGGHLEPGDATLAAAASREAREESGLTGLRLDPDPLLLSRHEVVCGGVRRAWHLDVQYLVTVTAASTPTVSTESDAVQWFPSDHLPDVDASVQALVTAAGSRLHW